MLNFEDWKKALKEEDIREMGGPVSRSDADVLDLYFIYVKHNRGA
jgi:hypothetical protein